MPRLTRLLPALAVACLIAPAATSHPHMIADARLDVTLTPDRKAVQSLRHIWRFDEISSSTMLIDLDLNGDLQLDQTELASGAQVMLESMADYDYFQLVTLDGKDVEMNPPAEIVPSWEGNQLFVMLETKPKARLPLAGKVSIGVYDPTFYVAIDFTEDDKMVVADMPANCARSVVRPDPDEAIAQNEQQLTEAFTNDAANNDMSKIFATRLELTCTVSGVSQ